MEIDLQRAYNTYESLSDEEKEMIRKVMTGKARSVIRKVFGDDFDAALGEFILPRSKRGKGLASQK